MQLAKFILNPGEGHPDFGTIRVEDSVCDLCNEQKPVIDIDQTDGEKQSGCVCLACATDALEGKS